MQSEYRFILGGKSSPEGYLKAGMKFTKPPDWDFFLKSIRSIILSSKLIKISKKNLKFIANQLLVHM